MSALLLKATALRGLARKCRLAVSLLLITLSASLFAVSITRSDSDIIVGFEATQGTTYRLERKTAITDTSWQSIVGVNDFTAMSTGAAQITDPGALSLERAFYRVNFLVNLTVTKSGPGTGTVTSDPAGIACGAMCSADFLSSAMVSLTAEPGASSIFFGWGGDCSGNEGCTVTMDAARNVTAVFYPSHINCIGAACTQTLAGEELGQPYISAAATGTYTLSAAMQAANAWPPAGTVGTGTCQGGGSNMAVFKGTPTSCTVWIYSGTNVGRLRYNSVGNGCLCPTGAGDPTWN